MTFKKAALLIFAHILLSASLFAQNTMNELGFSGVFFFSYENYFDDREIDNQFLLKRGYITFKQDLSDIVSIRFTQDVTVDQENDGEGDIELRLKYALVNVALADMGFIHNADIEFGVISRPWLDFEQSINDYRAQQSMFLDRHNILSSADYGISFSGQLGEDLPEHLQSGIRSNPGRYGSFSIGIYNGGGYSALEKNNNKLLEGRLSLRPLAEILPGFQTSFLGAYGKGNISQSPDFRLAATALSYESKNWVSVLQGFISEGDGAGEFIYTTNYEAINLEGWSFFSELKPFELPISLTLRYEELYNQDVSRWHSKNAVAGLAYRFSNRSKIILNVDRNQFNRPSDREFTTFSIITEIRF